MLLVVVNASILLALSGIGTFAARATSTMTMSMTTVMQLMGTTAHHSNVAASASGIAAVGINNNSMAAIVMDMAARLTEGVDLVAVSMTIVAVLLLKIQ